MNIPCYSYSVTDNLHEYYFQSEGPNGIIDKLIIFVKFHDNPQIYNLAFGDINPKTGLIDDKVNSNNKDREKVLATVAATITDFSKQYGNHYIFATGSTASRTRLYQMSITKFLDELKVDYEIFGYKNDKWHDFKKGVNYEAFMAWKR